MSFTNMIPNIDNQTKVAANTAQNTLAGNVSTTDPQTMLKAQYDLQQYSVLVNLQSSIQKEFKDMITGVISKIG